MIYDTQKVYELQNLTLSINFSPVHKLIMKIRVSSFKANLN